MKKKVEACKFGCGQMGIYKLKNGKFCCSEHHSQCPVLRAKNSAGSLGSKPRGAFKKKYVRKKKLCVECNIEISSSNYKRHVKACKRGTKPYHNECEFCGSVYDTYHKLQKFCSYECSYNYLREHADEISCRMKEDYASGKIKPYGGNLKRYQHIKYDGKEITVIGSYEKRTCIILDNMTANKELLGWKYESEKIPYIDESGIVRTYFPDFTLIYKEENRLLETKGFERIRDSYKWKAARELGFKLDVWFEDDIKFRYKDFGLEYKTIKDLH